MPVSGFYRLSQTIRRYPELLGVFLAVFYLICEWFWKFLFIGDFVWGIYWLFVFTDRTVLPLAIFYMALGVLFGMIWIAVIIRRANEPHKFLAIAATFVVLGFMLLSTFIPLLARNTVHMDTLRVKDKVYYLAAYPMFAEVNYALFVCDYSGVFCNSQFISGDLTGPESWPGKLEYSLSANELLIQAGTEGVIYTYPIP